MDIEINIQEKESSMRGALADGLIEQMRADKNVVYIDADLVTAMDTGRVFEQCPAQSFNIGIMEANMMGVAAGMSMNGMIPFIHSFGVFSSRRMADQIFISGCYNNANVKILGSDPGIAAETNGGTHMPLEDIGVLRSFPGLKIMDVADTTLMREVMRQAVATYGMMYIRFPRKGVQNYYTADEKFELGRGKLLRNGSDVSIIASGLEVVEALRAAELLASEGISARVVDMFTVKPIDAELVAACARETRAIVTAENHNYIGGLGSAVCEVVCETCPVPVVRVGSQDRFGEVGSREFLSEIFGITAAHIAAAAKNSVKMKHHL